MLKSTVIGNIGGDAEIKSTKSGKSFVSFSVAHDKGKDQPTTWVRVYWFGGVNHPLLRYLHKGAKLVVTGDLSVSAYADRNGQPAVGVDLFADSVDIVLYPKREEAPAGTTAQNPSPVSTGQPRQTPAPQNIPYGPGNPEYDKLPDFLKDDPGDMPV